MGRDDDTDEKKLIASSGKDTPNEPKGSSRRSFLKTTAAGAIGAVVAGEYMGGTSNAEAQEFHSRLNNEKNRRILIKGGVVLSMDASVGDFETGDVLIQGKKIAAVGQNLSSRGAQVIDASNMIVLPGFCNSHNHMFQGNLRGYFSDALLLEYLTASRASPTAVFHQYTPEDVYLGALATSLCSLNEGVTTSVDTSQSSSTPQHTDANIMGLRDGGVRAVFAYSATSGGNVVAPTYAYPQDLLRIQKQYFSSKDQLMTLALGTSLNINNVQLAHSADVPIVTHFQNPTTEPLITAIKSAGLLTENISYVHCLNLTDSTWSMIRDSGGKVSLTIWTDQTLGQGYVALQKTIDYGLLPSFSTDADSFGPSDMFTQMRAAFALQRSRIAEAAAQGGTNLPKYLNTRDILRMATLGGAQAAHVGDKVGSLTPGKEADIVLLRTNLFNAAPLHSATGTVVNFADASNVDTVFVAGRVVKWRGNLVGWDLDKILKRLVASGKGLIQRAGYPHVLLGSCCTNH